MISGTLTKESPETPVFYVYGEAYICLKGTGTVSVFRKIGKEFELATYQDGIPMVFDGLNEVLFNSYLSSNKKIPYKLVAETNSAVTYEIAVEDK